MDIKRSAGTKLGNYEIKSLIGKGEMGVACGARGISLNQPVPPKIFSPTLNSDLSCTKAEAATELDRPNVLQIHDFGEKKNLPFFTVKHVGGNAFDGVLKREEHLEADKGIRIVIQAPQGGTL